MAKRVSLEDDLAELSRTRHQGKSSEATGFLRRVLSGRVSLAVAKAAQIAAEFEENSLVDALEQAFDRFLANPVKTDKGCQAKAAIADALHKMNVPSDTVFLRGIRHVQMEPSFGPPVDTAARLRGLCALGLVRMNHPEAMNELARLLADKEADARIMAARAIVYAGDAHGEPLLRFKIHSGDREPQVIAECFLALLRLTPEISLGFVAEFLNGSDEELIEAAAAALGESRNVNALRPLKWACERTLSLPPRRAMLLAVASLRCEGAIEFLLEQLAGATGATAMAAMEALALYKHDEMVRRQTADIVSQSGDRQLAQAFQAKFKG